MFQTYNDALTTVQLASRIHRMRRRKHKFPLSIEKSLGLNNTGTHTKHYMTSFTKYLTNLITVT